MEPSETDGYLPEEKAALDRQRRELEAVLRFMSRSYVYLLCKGRLRQAEDLLRCFRGLGDYRPPALERPGAAMARRPIGSQKAQT